ncbi:MAG: hypothetical protein IJG45_06385, partial [Oscillospiraceae bacterium]|nr:hypothetical protein [Oscillospiraceae bacterium]
MKKRILSLVLALAMVVSLFAGLAITANAAETLIYTLTPASGSNNSYASNCDVAISGITWNVTGNSTMQPWRIGGKSITAVDRTVYSKTAMSSAISKVDLVVGAASSITVNSLNLVVASDSNFTTVIDTVSGTFAANSTITFTPTSGTAWATGAYYKFVFNVTVSGSSNKFVEFTSAAFYYEDSSPACTHENTTLTGAVAASCTTDGYTGDYICDDCGATVTAGTVIPATGHNYVDGVCSVCGAVEGVQAAGWYLVDDYTSLEDGVYAIISNNNYAFNGTISSGHGQKTADAFSFDASGYAATAPSGTLELTFTSTANGFTIYDATLGYLYATKASSGGLAFHAEETSGWSFSADGGLYAANNAHLRSYNDTFRTYASNTNNTVGLAHKVVNTCTHNWVAGSTVLPTCTEDGYTPYTCSLCNETKQDDIVPALGHLFGAATDNNNGTHTQTCSRCQATITSDCTFEVTEAGGNEFECTVCGYTKEVTQFYLNTTVADDDQVVIYNPSSGKALSATASGTKLAGVDVPSDYYSITKLCIPEGAVIMTVADYNNGQFHLTIDDNGTTLYLTSGATGNSLSFAALADPDYALWEIEGTNLKNVNAVYNNNAQYLEYYNGFTAYGYNANNASQYVMELFTDAVPACLHPNTTLTGAVAAGCLLPGYTGDLICDDCGATVSVGTAIPATGHNFVEGTCANCGATQLTAVNVTSLIDGETVYIYNAGTALAMTAVTDVAGKFIGVPGSVSGSVLTTSSDATLFTVHVVAGGYKFEAPNGLFLTYGDARDTLTLAADSTKAIWSIDASYHVIDVNSGYTYNDVAADLYLEAYNGYFTTYATSSLSAAFVMAFYDPNATEHEHVWGEGVVTTAATCVDDGVMTYTCSVCNHTKTEVIPATGVHTYVEGVCSVCGAIDPNSVDYSGNYYIATKRSESGNYWWMTNTLPESGTMRYEAVDSELTTLPAEIDSDVDAGKVWTLTKQQDGTYLISSGGQYIEYTSGNSATLGETGKALNVSQTNGLYNISFENEESGATVTRYLSLNHSTNSNFYAFYKGTQDQDLELIPVTGTVTPPASHTPVSHAAVAATCTTAGNVAYYTCSECETAGEGDHYGKYYSDATLETELSSIVIAATGHTLVYTDNGDGTHDATCSVCSTLVVDDEACTYDNGVCTLCDAEEPVTELTDPNLTIVSTSLSLQSYIGAQFAVNTTAAAEYDSVYVVVTQSTPSGDLEY